MFKKWLLSLTGLLVFCLVAGLAAACAPAGPGGSGETPGPEPEQRYTAAFETNGGSPVDPVEAAVIAEAPVSEREGYALAGWYTDPAFSAGSRAEFPYTLRGDTVFYALWELDASSDGVILTLHGDSYAVTGYTGSSPTVAVPAAKDGISVTEVAAEAFRGQETVTYVFLPDTVTAVGDGAFYGCSALEEVRLPERLTAIGNAAFYGCRSLTGLSLPEELTVLGSGAFAQCRALTEAAIPARLAEVGAQAFYGCTGLTAFSVDGQNPSHRAVDGVLFNKSGQTLIAFPAGRTGTYSVPAGVRTIEDFAFAECAGLTAVTLGSVTEIGAQAFRGSGLTAIALPASVRTLGEYAFYGCTALERADIGGITALGDSTFRGCTALKEIDLGAAAALGERAFADCTALERAELPATLTEIGRMAFAGCTALQAFAVEAGNTVFSAADGVLFDRAGRTLVAYPAGKTGAYEAPAAVTEIGAAAFFGGAAESVSLPNVTAVGQSAFAECAALRSVTLSDKLTALGAGAFDGCTALEMIVLPEGIGRIEELTFRGCNSLTEISLPESLTYIGQMAFADCSSLEEIALPAGVEGVGYAAFAGCDRLTIRFSGSTDGWETGWNPDGRPVVA